MRGPFEHAIEAEHPHRAGERELRRPPGGKALIRLLQLLESAGHIEMANASLEFALSEKNREEFMAKSVRFTARPSGQPFGDRLPHSRRSRAPEEREVAE